MVKELWSSNTTSFKPVVKDNGLLLLHKTTGQWEYICFSVEAQPKNFCLRKSIRCLYLRAKTI